MLREPGARLFAPLRMTLYLSTGVLASFGCDLSGISQASTPILPRILSQ